MILLNLKKQFIIVNHKVQQVLEGIAIPHAKVAAVKSPAIAFGKSKEGVDYQSLDGQPAHLFFMIAAPEGGAQTHIRCTS